MTLDLCQMCIRPGEARDGADLTDIFRRSVLTLGPRRYSSAQVAAWAARAPPPEWFVGSAGDGRCRLVAADASDRPVAFADLIAAESLIAYFYCAPEAAGAGVSGRLYAVVEQATRAAGLVRLQLVASPVARGFFERCGYTALSRRDFDLDGVPIFNFAMAKRLRDRQSARS